MKILLGLICGPKVVKSLQGLICGPKVCENSAGFNMRT